MTECDKLILASLNSYMNGTQFSAEFDEAAADDLLKKSKEQKIFPIVFLQNSAAFERVFSPEKFFSLKTQMLFTVSAQVQRTAELVRVCRLLESENIIYIVFKGAVCRAMYKNPEYRISSDEDLLVKAEEIRKAAELLCRNGYEILSDKGEEIKLLGKRVKMILELHSSLVSNKESPQWELIDSEIKSQLESVERTDIGAGEVNTFEPTYGFLTLCIHFYTHFIISGIGIRQVMDMACFVKTYSERIDFDYIFSQLESINAKKLIISVLEIGAQYFGLDFPVGNGYNEMLLDDLLCAGVYGTADRTRLHSGSMTKKYVHGNKGFFPSLVSSVFPSDESIEEIHPELKGNKKKIRVYKIRRIINFAGEKGKIKSLLNAEKRKKLLKELGVIR